MKNLLGLASLMIFTTSQVLAGTFTFSQLTLKEQQALQDKCDNLFVVYDESTDDIIIDEHLEKELRANGILKTEASVQSTVCTGGGH